mmetsp:Transcript_67689/g.180137  ORF Transcript_67689/g.180137 Transcript_67689/m.180137 type:complete len:236 (-) Transcript_67689:153-860(-)
MNDLQLADVLAPLHGVLRWKVEPELGSLVLTIGEGQGAKGPSDLDSVPAVDNHGVAHGAIRELQSLNLGRVGGGDHARVDADWRLGLAATLWVLGLPSHGVLVIPAPLHAKELTRHRGARHDDLSAVQVLQGPVARAATGEPREGLEDVRRDDSAVLKHVPMNHLRARWGGKRAHIVVVRANHLGPKYVEVEGASGLQQRHIIWRERAAVVNPKVHEELPLVTVPRCIARVLWQL